MNEWLYEHRYELTERECEALDRLLEEHLADTEADQSPTPRTRWVGQTFEAATRD
jgi:hypothetical protein